ncbi:MAG: ABC transporter permease [Pirellulaceae bacterium]
MKRTVELAVYALQNSRRAKLRTSLTVAGIAIASGALVSMIAFVLGLRQQIEGPIERLGLLNHIEVEVDGAHADSVTLDDELIDKIEQLDGVRFAYPDFRLAEATLKANDKSVTAYAVGVPREAGLLDFAEELLVAGRFFSLGEGQEVVVSQELVKRLGFEPMERAVGQTVEVSVSGLTVVDDDQRLTYEADTLPLAIVGVYQPPKIGVSLGGDTIMLPVDLMRKMPSSWMEGALQGIRSSGKSARGYPQVIVRTERPVDVLRVEPKLRELGLRTSSVVDRVEDMRNFFVFMEALLTAVGTVALVVAGLGILNTLLMTVMERYQEIGLYKAIGASNNDIRWIFLVEASVTGLLGGIAGLLLARVVSYALAFLFNRYAEQYGIRGPDAVFVFPWWLLVGGVAYSVVISVVSGLYPATKAARIDPIQALRGQ